MLISIIFKRTGLHTPQSGRVIMLSEIISKFREFPDTLPDRRIERSARNRQEKYRRQPFRAEDYHFFVDSLETKRIQIAKHTSGQGLYRHRNCQIYIFN